MRGGAGGEGACAHWRSRPSSTIIPRYYNTGFGSTKQDYGLLAVLREVPLCHSRSTVAVVQQRIVKQSPKNKPQFGSVKKIAPDRRAPFLGFKVCWTFLKGKVREAWRGIMRTNKNRRGVQFLFGSSTSTAPGIQLHHTFNSCF